MDIETGIVLLRVSGIAVEDYLRTRPGARWDIDTLRGDALDGAVSGWLRFDPARGELGGWCYSRACGAIIDGVRHRSVVSRGALHDEPDLTKHPAWHQPVWLVDTSLVEIPDEQAATDVVLDRDEAVRLVQAAGLSERERAIVVECVMFGTCTHVEMARRYRVTASRIAQLQRQALDAIRHEAGLPPAPLQVRLTAAQHAQILADPRSHAEVAADYGISAFHVRNLKRTASLAMSSVPATARD